MESTISSNSADVATIVIDNNQILSALALESFQLIQARVNDALVIRAQYLQSIPIHMEQTLARGISDQERVDRFHRNEKRIYNFSILDKVITALANHPEKAWPMRHFLSDVSTILNVAPYRSIQFFLLAHLAFRYDHLITIFDQTVHLEPSEEVDAFLLPTKTNSAGRELTLMEKLFLEKWLQDFQAWIRSPAVTLE